MAQHHDLADRTESPRRFHLFLATLFDKLLSVLLRVPCAFGTVGEDEMVDDASIGGPLRQRSTALKFSIVGMGHDGQSARGGGEVSR